MCFVIPIHPLLCNHHYYILLTPCAPNISLNDCPLENLIVTGPPGWNGRPRRVENGLCPRCDVENLDGVDLSRVRFYKPERTTMLGGVRSIGGRKKRKRGEDHIVRRGRTVPESRDGSVGASGTETSWSLPSSMHSPRDSQGDATAGFALESDIITDDEDETRGAEVFETVGGGTGAAPTRELGWPWHRHNVFSKDNHNEEGPPGAERTHERGRRRDRIKNALKGMVENVKTTRVKDWRPRSKSWGSNVSRRRDGVGRSMSFDDKVGIMKGFAGMRIGIGIGGYGRRNTAVEGLGLGERMPRRFKRKGKDMGEGDGEGSICWSYGT